LYCIDYDIDENPELTAFNKNKLYKTLTVIKSHFENDDEYELFVRAFLTIKENDYYQDWWQWSYSFECMKGDLYSPTRMKYFAQKKNWHSEYLKELFNQLINKGTFKKIIDDYIIPPNMPNWKQRLIKDENLLKGATFILVPHDDSYCKLAWQQRPSREDQIKKIK